MKCGVDIVKKSRFYGKETIFAKKILSDSEVVEFESTNDKTSFLAKRFAAKEAFSKAFGTGIGKHIGFKDIFLLHRETGEPFFGFSSKISQNIKYSSVSISDEDDFAIAFVLLEIC